MTDILPIASHCNLIISVVAPQVSVNNNATIIIDESDGAHGIVQFSETQFSASEGQSNFVTVSRSAGTFGEVRIH